jgi:hypothetical protein
MVNKRPAFRAQHGLPAAFAADGLGLQGDAFVDGCNLPGPDKNTPT